MGNFMIVEQIWIDNTYRNFNYLIACPETGEALAVDPLNHTKCLAVARDHGWDIRQILNTHEHGDHIGGNQSMIVATGAHLLAHASAGNKIQGINRGLSGGDIVRVGRSVELGVLDTPGHTMTHICLLSHTDVPALFSGDTLFNAGAETATMVAILPSFIRHFLDSSQNCQTMFWFIQAMIILLIT